jgi:hypothetical protein
MTRATPGRRAWVATAAFFLVPAVVFVSAGLFYSARLGVSGDEPHYLLMAQSLWRDGDLDLENNVVRGDWEEYTPRAFAPHYGAPRRDGRPFPAHSPGLALLLAPAYAVGGRTACVVLVALLAALLAGLVPVLARRLTGDAASAQLAWALAAGPPLFFYSFHLYTETPSALALVGALLLLLGRPSPAAAAAAALLASALPWLHLKMAPVALVLGGVAVARLRGRPLVAFLAVAGAMAAVFLGYYHSVFGRATPLAVYGGVPSDVQLAPLRSAAGLLLDRSYGLLPHAPAYLLALAGLGPLVARRRDGTLALVATGLAALAPVVFWRMWWGGQCPPGRFLVPLVPVLAVAAAAAVAEPARGMARWRWGLLLLGVGLAAFAIHDPEARLLLSRANRPTRLWAELSGGTTLERYLPSLTRGDPFEDRVALVWVAALAVLVWCDRLARHRALVDAWFRSLALALLLLLGVGAGVKLWARAGQPVPAPPPGASATLPPGL